jgi:hypothetical protein
MKTFVRWVQRSYRAAGASRWWNVDLGFTFAGHAYELFVGGHNCGWPPARMTERCVELALAHRWLSGIDRERLLEVGAVTPYYWPYRVPHVLDPFDPHPLVTLRTSILAVDMTARPVLSISTFEHIGRGDYGLEKDPGLVIEALEKVFSQSRRFLLTVPRGFNSTLDAYLIQLPAHSEDIRLGHLVRSEAGNDWREEIDPEKASLPYGRDNVRSDRSWANSVAVISRGPLGPGNDPDAEAGPSALDNAQT